MKFDPTLYLVTDSTGRTDDDFLSILEKALTGGVTLVQLRLHFRAAVIPFLEFDIFDYLCADQK